MTVSDFYYRWVDQLPDVLKPNSEAERINYVDLINRSLFYFCLDDHYIQEQICNMKEANPKLKTFLDEAIAAEAKRKSFKDIGASSSSLDNSGGVAISELDMKSKKNFKKKVSYNANQSDKGSTDHKIDQAQKGAQTQTQKQSSKEHTKSVSHDSGSKKKKVPRDTCRLCLKKGHRAKNCLSATKSKTQVSSVGVTDEANKASVEQFSLQVSAVQDSDCVGLFATRGVGP